MLDVPFNFVYAPQTNDYNEKDNRTSMLKSFILMFNLE